MPKITTPPHLAPWAFTGPRVVFLGAPAPALPLILGWAGERRICPSVLDREAILPSDLAHPTRRGSGYPARWRGRTRMEALFDLLAQRLPHALPSNPDGEFWQGERPEDVWVRDRLSRYRSRRFHPLTQTRREAETERARLLGWPAHVPEERHLQAPDPPEEPGVDDLVLRADLVVETLVLSAPEPELDPAEGVFPEEQPVWDPPIDPKVPTLQLLFGDRGDQPPPAGTRKQTPWPLMHLALTTWEERWCAACITTQANTLSLAPAPATDLLPVDLPRLNLPHADLPSADLSSADRSSADLSSADPSGEAPPCLPRDLPTRRPEVLWDLVLGWLAEPRPSRTRRRCGCRAVVSPADLLPRDTARGPG